MNEKEPHYAGFWRRNAAYVIDYFVIAIFLLILLLSVVALGFWLGLHNHLDQLGVIDQVDQLEIWINIILGLSLLLYFAGMESSAKQATLGKMAAGLVVTDLQAERITFLRAIGRNLAKILSALVLGIGFLMVAFTKRKRGLHDKVAGTLVVKQNKSRLLKVFLLIFLFWVLVISGLGYFFYVTILPQWTEIVQQQFQIPEKSSGTPSGVSSEKSLSSKQSRSTQVLCKADSDGLSSITCDDGSSYTGDVSNGVPHGQGTYTYARGDKYVGQFKSLLRDGQGSYSYASGNKYVGGWKDDKQDGQGTFTWANGDRYVGEFKKGQRHGQGTLTWADGNKFVGEWKNGKQFKGADYLPSGGIKRTHLNIKAPDLKVSGVTVAAGPALLRLVDTTWKGDQIGLKVYLSTIPEIQSNQGDVKIIINRVVDKNDRNVHDRQEDRKHNKALYDLRGGDELFSSDRDIETISGFEAKNLKHIEGRLIIALPVNPETVTFNADEIGVARTAAGSTITLLNVQQLEDDSFGNKRARVTIHFAGKANSYRGHKGYNLEGKELKTGPGKRIPRSGDADGEFGSWFYPPGDELKEGDPLPVKIEFFLAEKIIEYTYPFKLKK